MKTIRRLIDRLHLDRCECGGIIWPWQRRVIDREIGWIHKSCGDPGVPCPACKGQTGEDFTCSICGDSGIYPEDSTFLFDPLALAAQAGWDYAGAPEGFTPMYATTDMSDEATNFWNACHSRTRRADRLMDALFGPEDSKPTGSQSQVVETGEPKR